MCEILENFVDTPCGRTRFILPSRPDRGLAPALLLHGSGGRADVWRPVLDLFRRINPIAIDLPGHGGSNGPLLKTVGACSAFIEVLRARLELPRMLVVGQSLGGAIAQQYAHEHAAHCFGIVVADSAVSRGSHRCDAMS